jgi:short subunit dehydrogenase-like uncharacterized protein
MTLPITLLGATGYTGRRLARLLDQSRLSFRIAGRSADRLAALSASLPSRPAALVADAGQPDSLPALFHDTGLLINCAGPFTDLGEPVVALAAANGIHYLDITNELSYVYRLRQYDALARRSGAAIVPACAFEVAISDCVIAQMAREVSLPLRRVDVTYALPPGVISYGTRLSGLRTFATSWLAYRHGQWVQRLPGGAVRRIRLGERTLRAVAFPSAEVVTVPSHVQVRDVQAWLVLSARTAGLVAGLLPVVSVLLRTPLGWLTALSFRHLAPPPPETPPANARFAIHVAVSDGAGERCRVVRGHEPYGLTAEIAAYAARVITAEGYARRGVLAPSQALDPDAFLAWLQTRGVTLE